MHDDSTPVQDPSSPPDVTPATEPAAESAGITAANRRPVAWPGFVGLLIALLTAAGGGYLWNKQREQQLLNEQFVTTQHELTARSTELGQVTNDIKNLMAADQKLDDNVIALTRRFERQLEELPARMSRIETTLNKIPGVAEQARSAWLLAEAEYFLKIANAQLILGGNVNISLRALELADTKIKDLGNPGLTSVRAKISDERTALKAVPQPDTEGIVLELGSLAEALHTLPLSRRSPDHFSAELDKGTETGWQRARRVIIDALSNIISVRRSNTTITPLMSAAEEDMLVRSLDIELQIARLAVIRNEGDLYRTSLLAVASRLERYFDGTAQSVQTARMTISRLAEVRLAEELPDISGSLNLLLNLGDEAAAP
jgi:uroporphyrin-3 C-methyltransferase